MPGMLWDGSNRAVPIHPPHQCDDTYANEDNQSIISGVSVGVARGYFQGGQSFSPPTRQHRDSENNSVDDLTHQSYRLNEDYSDLSERVQRHESHQNELQHYIQLGAEGGKQESKKPDKSQQLTPSGDPKVAQLAPAKKVERKLAGAVVKGEKPQPGSATKGDKSQKPAAWK